MKKFGFLAFRLSHPASERISDEFINFYRWLAEALSGEECKLINDQDKTSIPLSYTMIKKRPSDITHLFSDNIKRWEESPDIVIIDLSNPPDRIVRGGQLAILASSIVGYNTANQDTVFIILLPEYLPEGDIPRDILSTLIEKGAVLIIDDSGNVTGKYPGTGLQFDKYIDWLRKVRKDPREALSIKMIRRLGHFKRYRNDEHYECVRYFFDGTLCEGELVGLVQDYVADLCRDKNDPFILYHAPISPWLERPLLALQADFTVMDVETYIRKQPTNFADDMIPMLVVPMVDSGDTLRRRLEELSQTKYPLEPNVLSIMSTKATDEERGLRTLQVGNKRIQIQYLLQVEQVRYPIGDCPLCKHDVPELNLSDEDDIVMLSPWDNWDMVFERGIGFKDEDDVPSYRKRLPTAPRYPELVRKNGAWLATKVRALFDFVPKGFPSDPVIVCPREEGSIVFTDCLNLAFEVTIIRVPKEYINLSKDFSKEDFFNKLQEKLGKDHPNWYVMLDSLSTEQVVVMDEFCVSGGTWKGLMKLLQHFGHNLSCAIAITNFNPSLTIDGLPIYSLYEIQSYPKPELYT